MLGATASSSDASLLTYFRHRQPGSMTASVLEAANATPEEQEAEVYEEPTNSKKRKRGGRVRLRNFLCMHPGCGKSFTDNAHLRDHTFVHSGEKNLSCDVCGKKFARHSTLHDHKRVHTGEKPYACSHEGCDRRYSSRAALRFHLSVHNSTNAATASPSRPKNNAQVSPPVICGLCNQQFATLEALQDHKRTHEQPPVAPDYSSQLVLQEVVEQQQRQIAQLQAELEQLRKPAKKPSKAPKTSKPTAAASVPVSEPQVAPVRFLEDGVKPFQCLICERQFANFYQLSFHGKQHPQASTTDVVGDQEPLPVGPKYCPVASCEYATGGKSLKNLQTLKRHYQRRHQEQRPHICHLCPPSNPKTFKTRENLRAHEKECRGGKPFVG